jgi:hypothetical protein
MNTKVIGVLVVLLAFAAIGSASTVGCAPNGGVVVGVGAVSSVVCGPFTFNNFSAVVIDPPGGAPAITLAPSPFSEYDNTANFAFLTFNTGMTAAPGEIADLYFYFQVTGPVNQVDLGVSNSAGAFITETYCSTPIPTSGVTANQCGASGPGSVNGSISAGAGQNTTSAVFNNVGTLYIFKDIMLNNSDGQTSTELSSFTQSFHTSGEGSTSSVPEPMTLSMMGVGLLGLGLIRRQKSSSGGII